MELVAFLPLLFVRMSLFALWNASPSRQTQREEYNSENVIDLLEALNVTRGGVRGVSKVKGPEAGLVAWRFRSRTPHLMLPREHALYLLSSAHGSLGLHLIGQQARQTTATLLSLMSHGQTLLRLVSCTRSNTLRLEYPTHTHTHSDTHTHTHSHSDTHTHSLLLPGGSPFSGGGWVQLALGLEAHRVALFINCREEEVVELSQPDEVINLRLPMDLQVTFASDAEDPNSKFSGSWQTAEMSTRAYQSRPWTCPNLTEPLPPPTPRSEMLQTEGSISPIMLLDERVGVANDQPQRVVLGAPGRRAQSPTHTSANAETLPQTLPLTHTHTLTHTSHGERIGRLEERLDGVNTMLEMLKNQNVELAERVRSLEECECVKRVCVWEDAEVESGKSWETDTHSLCTCTNGQVHCSTPYDGWAEFAKLRAEFVPEANGRGSFLPWHRYFLWSLERALRNASSCGVSVPYLEWTVDAGALDSSAAWQAHVFGGDGDHRTECVWLHPFQPADRHWSPCLRRRFDATVSVPDAVTMQLIAMETDFIRFSTHLQAASGLFLLWVGGHMATPLCAYDPAFLSHVAFVDRLWELWQERRAAAAPAGVSAGGSRAGTTPPGPPGASASELYPEELRFAGLEPFGVTLEDVRLSSQKLCTVYIPITLGSPCNHTHTSHISHTSHTSHTHTHTSHTAGTHASHTHTSDTSRGGEEEEEEEERVFDKRGFDVEGYDRSGYDSMGWDRHGYARDNYNRDHVDRQGYDSFGFDRYGFSRANLTALGMQRDGRLLLSPGNQLLAHLFPDGFNRYGYSALGLDRRGFDAFGFSRDGGVDQDGCNFFWGGPHYLRFYFHALMNVSLLPLHALANTPRVCPPISPLPSHWASQNWVGVDSLESRALIGGLAEKWANQRPFRQDYNPNVSSVRRSGLWVPVTPDLRFCFAWPWYSGCPLGSAPVTCPDLCQSARCRGQPGAVCHMITCGSCHTQWVEPNSGQPIECQDW